MESELFGHKRGSFTGAVADKKGLVQSAEGGTLFLDEVADLPLHMQVKLLRVVQEKTVRPVGESREETVDVRILSATHKNLAQLVAEGRFREDLFYRINVIEMRVPSPARAREDIPELADSDSHAPRAGACSMDAPRLERGGAAGAARATVPRQRARARERAGARAHAVHRRHDHCGQHQGARRRALCAGSSGHVPRPIPAGGGALGEQLEDIERDAIVKALEKTRYNKTAAAKLLGMSFRALRYRIKKLGIE